MAAPRKLTEVQLKRLAQKLRRCANSANYTARTRHGLDDRVEPEEVIALWTPETVCPFCGRRLTASLVSLDHIIPFSKGGRNLIENLQLVCSRDNRYKRNLSDAEYQGFLTHLNGLQTLFFSNYRPRGAHRA